MLFLNELGTNARCQRQSTRPDLPAWTNQDILDLLELGREFNHDPPSRA